MANTSHEDEYVLGVNDVEIARLGLQHAVWRPRTTDTWRRAGFTRGQHIMDVACGPGYATLDLTAIVGDEGRITAVDRSQRFLDVLGARLTALGARNVDRLLIDLDQGELPRVSADGAWCRWVFAFVRDPRRLVRALRDALRPGGVLVAYEYFDYATWRLIPPLPELEEFVQVVMRSWRESGGEPDVAVQLLPLLQEEGFEIIEHRAIIDVVSPRDFIWQWPDSFVPSGIARQVELGALSAERGRQIESAYVKAAKSSQVRMVTPGLMEIIARRT